MSKKETLEKFLKFMEKWRYEDFNAFETHFNRLMSMKGKEQLTAENEALKDSIAVILAQKKNVHKYLNETEAQLKEKDEELAQLNEKNKKISNKYSYLSKKIREQENYNIALSTKWIKSQEQLKSNTKQVCEKIKEKFNRVIEDEFGDNSCDTKYITLEIVKVDEFLDQIENKGCDK